VSSLVPRVTITKSATARELSVPGRLTATRAVAAEVRIPVRTPGAGPEARPSLRFGAKLAALASENQRRCSDPVQSTPVPRLGPLANGRGLTVARYERHRPERDRPVQSLAGSLEDLPGRSRGRRTRRGGVAHVRGVRDRGVPQGFCVPTRRRRTSSSSASPARAFGRVDCPRARDLSALRPFSAGMDRTSSTPSPRRSPSTTTRTRCSHRCVPRSSAFARSATGRRASAFVSSSMRSSR
jgi:hypothetical protein